jgi:hypothetical protein
MLMDGYISVCPQCILGDEINKQPVTYVMRSDGSAGCSIHGTMTTDEFLALCTQSQSKLLLASESERFFGGVRGGSMADTSCTHETK